MLWYSLKNAAVKASCSEDYVLQAGIIGEIKIRMRHSGFFKAYIAGAKKYHTEGYLAIHPLELDKFMLGNEEAIISDFLEVVPDSTDYNPGWKRLEKTQMGYHVAEDGSPSPVTVKRSTLFIMHDDLVALKAMVTVKGESGPERKEADAATVTPEIKEPKNNGGQPKKPFREALEYVFRKCLEEGNTAVISRGKTSNFIEHVRDLMNEEKKKGNILQYISDRIREIKKKHGKWVITMNEYVPENGKNRGKSMPARDYDDGDVSKTLCLLRQDNGL